MKFSNELLAQELARKKTLKTDAKLHLSKFFGEFLIALADFYT